jgi:DNA-binding winged helix-turn-helix (wHTH) protein
MDGERDPSAVLESGRFRVVRHRRELLVNGQPIELGGRAFDTLLALIDAGGSVIGKDELMRRIWPDRIVEETISRLRSPHCARFLAPIAI